MAATVTLQEMQALKVEIEKSIADPNYKPDPSIEVLKNKLALKFVDKAIWYFGRLGITSSEHLTYGIDVIIEPEDDGALARSSGGNLSVTLDCCTGAGCGDCDSFNVGP